MKTRSTVVLLTKFAFHVLLPMFVNSGLPLPLSEPEELGLYDSTNKVIILTSTNFNTSIFGQDHASLVEFYNSYCGHCKRFAPTYKKLANETWYWRDIIKVMAIDCAAEENYYEICVNFDLNVYPTLRYFKPQYEPSESDYGYKIRSQNIDVIRSTIILLTANENQTSPKKIWPNFMEVLKEEAYTDLLFSSAPPTVQEIILVFEPKNKTIGLETILNFVRFPAIQVRRIKDPEIAKNFGIHSMENNRLAAINRKGEITSIKVNEVDSVTSLSYRNALNLYLQEMHTKNNTTKIM